MSGCSGREWMICAPITKERTNLPFENYFRVNLKTPNESGEHLDRPTVPKDVLHILHVHTELVAEALLDVEGDLTEDAVDSGDSLICHRNLGKIGILEEAIVWLL